MSDWSSDVCSSDLNENALSTAAEYNRKYKGKGHITLPFIPKQDLVDNVIEKFMDR